MHPIIWWRLQLLHDVGHFEEVSLRNSDAEQVEPRDYRHQDTGADWLAQWFPRNVTEPVRLHVMAKRYLCTIEPGYFGLLRRQAIVLAGAALVSMIMIGGAFFIILNGFVLHPLHAAAAAARRLAEGEDLGDLPPSARDDDAGRLLDALRGIDRRLQAERDQGASAGAASITFSTTKAA